MRESSKTYAKNLTAGTWVVWEGDTYVVLHTIDRGNGHWTIDLSDGRFVDCLGYTSFVTV